MQVAGCIDSSPPSVAGQHRVLGKSCSLTLHAPQHVGFTPPPNRFKGGNELAWGRTARKGHLIYV